jgi:UDP-N-acetyl-D-mannosaminuronic acid dehydrogenase
MPILSDDQLVILRSTVYPGTTEWVDRYLRLKGKCPKVAFCPERITQGNAIDELKGLPQIVSGTSQEAEDGAAEVFSQIAPEIIRLSPMEAELAKLFCNAYRYIQFAATNQFYIIANSAGLDYYRILEGMKQNYPRMRDLPRAGFSAGPCLLKDTMQLAAFYNHGFSLGHTAMLVNEGLPLYVVNQMSQKYDLPNLTVGLLGMAYKAESDDLRSSLSYKLKKTLLFRAKKVLTTDPLVRQDPELLPLEDVLARSDLLILCVPHRAYQNLDTSNKPVIDIWNFLGGGALV